MLKAKNLFHALFRLDSMLNLWATFSHNETLNYTTKPLLMPLLAIYLLLQPVGSFRWARNLVLLGLIFSCSGDILLMYALQKGNFFIFGLISFLLAHICYISAFLHIASFQKGFIRQRVWLIAPFLLYLLIFNFYLFDGIPAELRIPVIIYSIIIMTMAISALNLKGLLPSDAFQWIFVGALFFLMSDSVLAAEKFKTLASALHFDVGIIIMLTYILGQYGIARGTANATRAR